MICSFNGKTLHVENVNIRKPISIWSRDPTDFQIKKYITIRTNYFMEENGEKMQISKEEADAFIQYAFLHTHSA